MKSLSMALSDHLQGETTTLAACFRIVRRDGVALGFTTHDRTLSFETLDYRPVSGFQPTAIASSSAFETDELEVEGALSAGAISEADLASGRFDGAQVSIFLVNWADLSQGALRLRDGWLGEVSVAGGGYRAELLGLTQKLRQTVGALASPECRADLGDLCCKIDPAAITVWSEVTSAADRATFSDAARAEPDGWFDYGLLTWATGANAGLLAEVKRFAAGEISLCDAMPEDIEPGDLYTMQAGCDKRFATCKAKFANAVNFRGEPFVPGVDALLDYPGMG